MSYNYKYNGIDPYYFEKLWKDERLSAKANAKKRKEWLHQIRKNGLYSNSDVDMFYNGVTNPLHHRLHVLTPSTALISKQSPVLIDPPSVSAGECVGHTLCFTPTQIKELPSTLNLLEFSIQFQVLFLTTGQRMLDAELFIVKSHNPYASQRQDKAVDIPGRRPQAQFKTVGEKYNEANDYFLKAFGLDQEWVEDPNYADHTDPVTGAVIPETYTPFGTQLVRHGASSIIVQKKLGNLSSQKGNGVFTTVVKWKASMKTGDIELSPNDAIFAVLSYVAEFSSEQNKYQFSTESRITFTTG